MAARSEARFAQDLKREIADEAKLPRPNMVAVEEKLKSSEKDRLKASRQVIKEPGISGHACILWNSKMAQSTDAGAVQIRKRREKLREDLIREMALYNGDPVWLVAWWYQSLRFYADQAEEANLPVLPERKEEDQNLPTNSTIRAASKQRPQSAPNTLRRSSSIPAMMGYSRSAKVPQLRGHADFRLSSSTKSLRATLTNDSDLENRRRELKKERAMLQRVGLAGKASGNLDLSKRFREETFNRQKLKEWSKSFRAEQAEIQLEEKEANEKNKRGTVVFKHRVGVRGSLPDQAVVSAKIIHKFELKIMAGEMGWKEDRDGSSAASAVGDDDSDVLDDFDAFNATANEVMLRSASLALLESSLIKKAGCKKTKTSQRYDEVLAERARILRSVSIEELSVSNLGRMLGCFGIERTEAVERIFNFLRLQVNPALANWKSQSSKSPGSMSKHAQQQDIRPTSKSLPFEVVYRLIREVQGHASARHSSEPDKAPILGAHDSDIEKAWANSELLRRLLFSVLTGRPGTSRSVGAAEQRLNDSVGIPTSLASLTEALRLMLSNSVLDEE
eukprot:TRINITY_DN32098_c0_g1_i1.p1 TRINITY_DN32098_c0_g1~~TRINITY_DN32098_c0_g1_i1.p1  ORF type:complete len:562 (+),score=120.80 TRINITY_DN32098_c0_g1_i1:1-1686(+)